MDATTASPAPSPATNPPPDLYEYAVRCARASGLKSELATVAEALGYSYSWFGRFSRGKMKGASYHRVRRIADYYMEREAEGLAAQQAALVSGGRQAS